MTESTCVVPGCVGVAGRPGTARGMCHAHYRHWQRHGTPEAEPIDEGAFDPIDLAYAAGFIDGEGSFGIQRSRAPRLRHGIQHSPRILAYNTCKEPIDFLAALFGGKTHRFDKRQEGWRDGYVWKLHGRRAIDTARLLMPYLKIKGLQAYLLSCFELEAAWSKGGCPEDTRMPDIEFERRETLYWEVRQANATPNLKTEEEAS